VEVSHKEKKADTQKEKYTARVYNDYKNGRRVSAFKLKKRI
jgi:hypothetical protein